MLLAILGYLALWFYTANFGNTKYLDALTGWGIAVMTMSVLLTFNHSIWYTNQLIRGKLWIYNYSAISFFIVFAILVSFLYVAPVLNVTLFFGLTQILLVGTAGVYWRMFASKTL